MGTGTGHQSVAHTPKYIGLACVVFVALAMVLSLYYLVVKRKSEGNSSLRMREPIGNNLHGAASNIDDERRYRDCSIAAGLAGLTSSMQDGNNSLGSLTGSLRHHRRTEHPGTAYTITINSQSATNLDEAILPLTEDKTRF